MFSIEKCIQFAFAFIIKKKMSEIELIHSKTTRSLQYKDGYRCSDIQ